MARLSWLVSANYLDSYQQPLTYTTNGTIPAGTTGTFPALNKQGVPANVVGTGTLAHSQQTSANLRLAYDVSPLVQATYSFGVWNNHQTSDPQTYLRSTVNGPPTFAGIAGFASSKYIWDQTHLSNAVSLKSDTKGVFDFDMSASTYNYLQDIQLNPFTVTPTGAGYSLNGKITRNDGTNWQNADAKGIWRPFGCRRSAGDQLRHSWRPLSAGEPRLCVVGLVCDAIDRHRPALFDGVGETRTGALWVQDAWKIVPNLKLTLGGRLETWRALDGFNVNHRRRHAAGADHRRPCRPNQPGLEFDELFAESVAVLRSEQGMEDHGQFRRSLSLSDRHRALSEHHGRRHRDFRQSDPDAGAGLHR